MSAPATLTRLTTDRTYTVLGERGLRYVGQTGAGRQHMFVREHPPSGTVTIQEPRLLELMSTGRVLPEAPSDA